MKNLEKNHNNRIGLYVFLSIVLIIMGYISSKLNNIPIIEATETSKEVYLPINWFYFYSMCFFVTIVFLYFILRFKNRKWEILIMATRQQQQQAKKMTAKRVKSTKEKIFNCTRGLISFDYIKEDGSWNISKIAKDTGASRTTVYKYLKK